MSPQPCNLWSIGVHLWLDELGAVTSSKTLPVDFVLDRSRADHSLRVCAYWISDIVRGDCQCVRVQSGRGFGAPVLHQRAGLWTRSLYARRFGLVNAFHSSGGSVRIRDLVDHSHPASRKVAKASLRRSSSSDSPTAAHDSMRVPISVDC
jgi:hypothetical protein